jgi:hypothetical protein
VANQSVVLSNEPQAQHHLWKSWVSRTSRHALAEAQRGQSLSRDSSSSVTGGWLGAESSKPRHFQRSDRKDRSSARSAEDLRGTCCDTPLTGAGFRRVVRYNLGYATAPVPASGTRGEWPFSFPFSAIVHASVAGRSRLATNRPRGGFYTTDAASTVWGISPGAAVAGGHQAANQ